MVSFLNGTTEFNGALHSNPAHAASSQHVSSSFKRRKSTPTTSANQNTRQIISRVDLPSERKNKNMLFTGKILSKQFPDSFTVRICVEPGKIMIRTSVKLFLQA
jgi:hypothetical protein